MQAERAGISIDSALALGKSAQALADSSFTGSVRITRDMSYPNMDNEGRFLRHVAVYTGYDSTENHARYEDYATLLRNRHYTRP